MEAGDRGVAYLFGDIVGRLAGRLGRASVGGERGRCDANCHAGEDAVGEPRMRDYRSRRMVVAGWHRGIVTGDNVITAMTPTTGRQRQVVKSTEGDCLAIAVIIVIIVLRKSILAVQVPRVVPTRARTHETAASASPRLSAKHPSTEAGARRGFERRQRTNLILLHEATVTHYVRSKDSGEAALDAFFGHMARMPLGNAVRDCIGAPSRNPSAWTSGNGHNPDFKRS